MFKRVAKRIRKKEKEEELGIDEEMKEMLGMHDTDSDESDSSADSDEESEGEQSEGETGAHAAIAGEDEEDGEDGEDSEDGEVEDEEEGVSSDEDVAPMTLSEALQDPLHILEEEPEVKGCIVCPGKLLKNPVMIDVHIKSGVSIL